MNSYVILRRISSLKDSVQVFMKLCTEEYRWRLEIIIWIKTDLVDSHSVSSIFCLFFHLKITFIIEKRKKGKEKLLKEDTKSNHRIK